jgi:hypothetical protein
MERHLSDFILWILCVDEYTHDVLLGLQLPHVRLLNLVDLETDELRAVKSDRSIGEYCWTLTPIAPRLVFNTDPTINRVTYIDADLWFRKDPTPIFNEFDASNKSVLITDHSYSPEYDFSPYSGQFCVQFITFVRNESESVRQWWEDRCLEWCYARYENNQFGDQKYLDEWPSLFGAQIHILLNRELALAPWNASRFPYGNAIFYHFHGLRLISRSKVDIGNLIVPNLLKTNVYLPYLADIRAALSLLDSAGVPFVPQRSRLSLTQHIHRKLSRLKTVFLPLLAGCELSL